MVKYNNFDLKCCLSYTKPMKSNRGISDFYLLKTGLVSLLTGTCKAKDDELIECTTAEIFGLVNDQMSFLCTSGL